MLLAVGQPKVVAYRPVRQESWPLVEETVAGADRRLA
jgi:hypothetical protein